MGKPAPRSPVFPTLAKRPTLRYSSRKQPLGCELPSGAGDNNELGPGARADWEKILDRMRKRPKRRCT